MPVSSYTETKKRTHPTWAQQLVARQHAAAPAVRDDPQPSTDAAIAALWSLFDTAYSEANAAFEAMGEPGRISVTRTPAQRIYTTTAPDGSLRTITIFLVLPVADGRLCGGAYIATNRSRLAMYVVPGVEQGRVRWRVANGGQAFTSEIVHDLFLGVFGDDPEATLRLSPLSGHDRFQEPWS